MEALIFICHAEMIIYVAVTVQLATGSQRQITYFCKSDGAQSADPAVSSRSYWKSVQFDLFFCYFNYPNIRLEALTFLSMCACIHNEISNDNLTLAASRMQW